MIPEPTCGLILLVALASGAAGVMIGLTRWSTGYARGLRAGADAMAAVASSDGSGPHTHRMRQADRVVERMLDRHRQPPAAGRGPRFGEGYQPRPGPGQSLHGPDSLPPRRP